MERPPNPGAGPGIGAEAGAGMNAAGMSSTDLGQADLGQADLGQATAEDVVRRLGTDLAAGLTAAQAAERLRQYGPNTVAEPKRNPLAVFLGKFWGLSAWMIEAIIVLSWLLHRYSDLYIVTALLVVNAVLSFVQEQRAAGVVRALQERLHVNARVLHEGAWRVISGADLVPGDVVRIRAGDVSPADVKISSGQLGVDQSALTGESLEAEKEADGVLYAGSVVRRGEANGVVIATGARTYYGRATRLVQTARPRLHMEEVVTRVVRWLLVIVGLLVALAAGAALVRGLPLLDIVPLLLVLLLGAIPVALPVMFTVSMALGSMELARQGVLVTRLSASEDAATMDVLCVDKTGTITANRLSVAEVIPLDGHTAEEALLCGCLASQRADQDPIDLALFAAAEAAGLRPEAYTQVAYAPFDPHTRRTEAVVRGPGQEFRVAKGAVAAMAQACGLEGDAVQDLEGRADEYARRGYRTLAVARSDGRDRLGMVGLVTLYDRPRDDSRPLVAELGARGVAVKVLTGDALPIAREVASSVGLGPRIVRAAELEATARDDPSAAGALAEESDGFAEIYPEGKYAVVRALQARGHVVGMTGDGVNDAPALRQAEVGIAVSTATDVAKGAASVVLTAEGLANIVALVDTGREIHQRIVTWVINKISRTVLKSVFIVGALFITDKFVVSAAAMLLMVLMTDFAKISLATDRARGSRSPEDWAVGGPVALGAILGLLMTAECFGLLFFGLRVLHIGENDQTLYTFSFASLIYLAIFSLLSIRERGHFWASRPSRTLLIALGIEVVVATAIVSVGIPGLAPLPPAYTLLVLGYALACSLLVNDLAKYTLIGRLGVARPARRGRP